MTLEVFANRKARVILTRAPPSIRPGLPTVLAPCRGAGTAAPPGGRPHPAGLGPTRDGTRG